MCREFNVVVERDAEGFYVASVPTLHGCHTQARSLDELMERIKEAIARCLDVQGETGESLDRSPYPRRRGPGTGNHREGPPGLRPFSRRSPRATLAPA